MNVRDYCVRASAAGRPSLAQGGDRIRSLGGPAALARTRYAAARPGACRPAGWPEGAR